jgi:uncharacterized protein
MTRYLALAARRPWRCVLACVLVAAVALGLGRKLELHTDMAELLPADHPAVAALQRLADHQRLGQSLIVIVESPDRAQDRAFLDALRPRLERLPAFAEIDWGPDRDLAAWKEHWRWMYADAATLERAERLLDLPDPVPALRALAPEHAPPSDRYELLLPDGTHRAGVMLWRPAFGIGGTRDHQALADVRAAIAATDPARFGVRVSVGGHLAQAIEDQDSIRDDLTFATLLCSALIFAAIWAYFRRLALVAIVFAPALLGLFVALAVARFTLHALNLNTAFLIAIILGNGINSPIVLLARYGEERLRGADVAGALAIAVRRSLRGTLAAMGAASIAYGALVATDFRGFSQFGLLGGIGMLLVWFATYAVVPPLLHLVDARIPASLGWRRPFGALGRAVARRPVLVLAGGLALAAAALVPLAHLARDPIEWNLRALRTAETPSRGVWDKAEALGMNDPDSGYVGSHGALIVDRPEQAEPVAAALRAQDRALGDPVFARVRTLPSLLPRDQDATLAALARIRAKLDALAPRLGERDRAELARWRPPDDLRPLAVADLPAFARRAFTERDGSVGRLVLVSVDPRTYSDWNGRDLLRLARHLQVDAGGRHWVAASPATVFAGMLETLVRDGPRVAVLAFAGVVLFILIVLGRRAALPALATQLVGLTWFGGVLALLGMKINFFNFVGLPITLGVGADYAANLAARLRDGRAAIPDVLAGTGAAVALCSTTTIIGYSSLLSSHNPALRSFGVVADVGEVCCLAAALLFLPALGYHRRGRLACPTSMVTPPRPTSISTTSRSCAR